MSTEITQAFVKQFEAEVHEAYQQRGNKLLNTVRQKSGVIGTSTTFQKVGKGVAGTKTRHGEVPVMNIDHTPVECVLADYYGGDWVDKLDELKTNIDERMVVANAGAYALGRKTDELIITAMSGTSTSVGTTTALTKNLFMSALEQLNGVDAPDMDRFCLVAPKQWSNLMSIDEFTNSQYVGDQYPFLKGTESRKWMNVTFILHNYLPKTGNIRSCFLYQKDAIGHAIGANVTTDISWHGDRAAHFINNMMSMGSALIDTEGCVKILVDDTADIS